MRKLLLALALLWPSLAIAQNLPTPAIVGVGGAYNASPKTCTDGQWCALQTDVNGKLILNASVSLTGSTSNASSGVATSSTNLPTVSYIYGFNGTTWDQLQVDASKFLKVNCAAGCAGGTFNNNSDNVATSATNGQSAAWAYVWDGATWDRLYGDSTNGAFVNVKTSVLPTGASTAANQTTIITALGSPFQAGGSIGNTTFASTQSGTWTVQPGNTANTTAWKVDGSSVTQPISAASLPLPALASTSTKQSDGSQKTQIVDGSGNVIASTSNNLNVQCANCSGSGASAVDEAAFTAGSSVFAPGGGFYQTTATSNALTNGQQGMWQLTANRAGFVNLRNASGTELGVAAAPLQVSLANTASNGTSVNVACTSGCSGSGGTSAVDEAAFTAGTTAFTPAGGFYQTTATSNALTNGQGGWAQMTAQRALFSNLRNSSGTEIGVSGAEVFVGGRGTAGSAVGGVLTIQGAASMTAVAISAASGSIASGAIASGAIASGAYAAGSIAAGAYVSGSILSGALASGAVVDITNVSTPIAAASATATKALNIGGQYDSTQKTLTNGQQASVALSSRAAVMVATGADTFNVTVNAALPAGTALLGKVGIDQTTPGTTNAVSLAQLGANSVAVNNGTASAGTFRVVIASDNTSNSNPFLVNGNVTPADGAALGTTSIRVYSAGGTYNGSTIDLHRGAANSLNSTGAGLATAQLVGQCDDTSPTALTENSFGNGRIDCATHAQITTPVPSATAGGTSLYTLTLAASTNATNVKASAGQVYSISGFNPSSATPVWISLYNTSGTPSCGTSIIQQFMIPGTTTGAGFVYDFSMPKAFSSGIAFCATTGIAGTGSVSATTYVLNIDYK